MTKIALAQCRRSDDGDVLAMAAGYVRRAQAEDAELVVFPEAMMTAYDGSPTRFAAASQPLDGPFATGMAALAASFGVWIVFTMNEANPDGGKPFNTAVAVDGQGGLRGVYRKVHLFDAQGYRESDYLAAGNQLFEPIETSVGKVGLGICYDLRFPELARAAALEGANVLLYPAAWVAGPGKVRQWKTLLAARAIENGVFAVGCGSVDANRCGASCVFAPDGTLVAEAPGADDGANGGSADVPETLLVADIDLARVDEVRTATPSLAHRRPELYGERYGS